MTNEQIQALKAAAEKWKAADKQYDKGEITIAEFLAANEEYGRLVIKPAATLSLLAEREADKALIAEQAKNIAKLERALDLARNSNSVLAIRSELQARTHDAWIEHDGKWRPESLRTDELVYLKTRKQELKIPYPAGKVKGWMHTGGDIDVMAYKIAEARTLTVKLPKTFWYEHDDLSSDVAVLEKRLVKKALREACAAAGITLVVGGE